MRGAFLISIATVVMTLVGGVGVAMAGNTANSRDVQASALEAPIDGAIEPPEMVWRLVPATQSRSAEQAEMANPSSGQAEQQVPGRDQEVDTPPSSSQNTTPAARLTAAIKSSPMITDECVARAAVKYQVPLPVMLGIMRTEGGRVGSASLNTDGSYDLGPMQVNDKTWVPILAKQELGADTPDREVFIEDMLRYNACYNVNMGFYIYAQYLREANGDYMRAVGFYNSHNPVAMRVYQSHFARNFAALFGGQLR